MKRPLRPGACAIATIFLALCAARAARADERAVAPAGGGLRALAAMVDIDHRVVRTRACASEAGCSADGSNETIPIALDAATGRAAMDARVEVVDIGQGKHLVHVKVQAKGEDQTPRDLAWEALLAADRAPIFAAQTGLARGDVGERTGTALRFVPREGSSVFVVRGEVREGLHICGQARGTPLSPELLDPASFAWQSASFQQLPADQRARAKHVVAAPKNAPADAPIAQLLAAVGSSVPDDTGGALVDGDPRTAWMERRASAGRGEFVVVRAPSEVPIARVALTLAPPGKPPADGASPKTLFLVTDTETFEVEIPEDAWSHPGNAYEVKLDPPVSTSCLTVVLEDAWERGLAHPDVMLAELTAYGPFDAASASLDQVAAALDGDEARAKAAIQILKRADVRAIEAIDAAFPSLAPIGKERALGIALDHPSCEATAPVIAYAMGSKDDAMVQRATGKVVECGQRIAPGLAALLEKDEAARPGVARALALLGPEVALAPLARVVGRGAPASRAAVRAAIATVAGKAEREQLRALVADATRPPEGRIDLLRAIAPRVGEIGSEADAAFDALLVAGAPMRTRYLLAVPIAALAATGDDHARALLADRLARDPEWPVRAHAAAQCGHVPALAGVLAAAAADPEPRVRQAALIAVGTPTGAARVAPVAVARLADDHWTFVREAAAGALAIAPASQATDAALAKALADPAPAVREVAASALGARGARTAQAALVARAEDADEDANVRFAAVEALGNLCAADALDLFTSIARAAASPMAPPEEARLGAAAIEALARLHPADLADRLGPVLAEGSAPGARALAKRALLAAPACR